jgi:hypothetical protein
MLPLLSLLALIALGQGCQTPTWEGALPSSFTPPTGAIFITFINTVIPVIGTFETPIQFRLIQNANLGIYSTMAMYEPQALDHFARASESASRRLCSGGSDFAKHRQVALAYTLIFVARNFFPAASTQLESTFATWGVDANRCNAPGSCADLTTPWGLAKKFTDEMAFYGTTDGWNADGSLSRLYNKIPYQDWRRDPYVPRNNPWTLEQRSKWQPLLEHNKRGYISYQEHVTPHIGQTARSIFFTDEELCAKTAPKPRYNLDDEIELTFARLADLDDDKKMEIELFDSKLTSLVPLMAQWYLRAHSGGTLDDWGFIQVDSIIISALYEATVVVWKEKVEYDLVRPPSYAHDQYRDQEIVSWAGPYQGTKTLLARDWQPYIRTMPHAEYPSGSACACGVFEAAMRNWTGYDLVAPHITPNGPLVFSQPDGSPLPAGSSKTEPGLVPAAPWIAQFDSWSDIAARCGQSRLDGGMHFTASIVHGRTLCYDMGTKIASIFEGLNAGQAPSYVVSINAPLPSETRC